MQAVPASTPPTDSTSPRSLWAELCAAVRGTQADYTKIPLRRAVFLLAVPMVLELVLESTFAVVDIFFVAKLGPSAVATVGLTESYLFLMYSIAMGLAMAVTAVIARRVGEGKHEEASITAVQAIFVALLASLVPALMGILYAPDLLRLMGGDAWTIEHGYRYARWMLGGNAVIMLLFVINAIFRGAGDAAIAMRVLWLANGLNILLCPLLIFGVGPFPQWGIEGAAIATLIGRGSGVLVQLWVLFHGGKHIRVAASHVAWSGAVLWNIVRTSLGGVGQMIVAMTSWIFLMRILASIGSEAVAGATIAIRFMMFTMMPAWGMSNAAATLVGQNLGAQQPDRAEAAVWQIGRYNMIYLLVISLAYFFLPQHIVGFFTDEPKVIAVGTEWLHILSYALFVYGWWMVSVQAFNGAGDTVTPTWINVFCFWLLELPLAWFLAEYTSLGTHGVFYAIAIAFSTLAVVSAVMFRRGRWKVKEV